jgi:hypothetical protein
VSAWGGLFNRFNPSMLSNLGYGGQGGNYGRELFGVADKNFGEVTHFFTAALFLKRFYFPEKEHFAAKIGNNVCVLVNL